MEELPTCSSHPLGTLLTFADGRRMVAEGEPHEVLKLLREQSQSSVSDVAVLRLLSSDSRGTTVQLLGDLIHAANEGSSEQPSLVANLLAGYPPVVVDFRCPVADCQRLNSRHFEDGGKSPRVAELVCKCGAHLPIELVHP